MPIQFNCPHCEAQTNVSDEFAGQSGPCVKCGKNVTIPWPAGPPGSAQPRKSSSTGWVVLLVIGVCAVPVLLACAGIMLAMLMPAVQASREAARRANCLNNMKQIGLAMHNYHSAHDCFPPAYIADEDGNPKHSWRVLILPYMEEKALYDQYNFDEPWDSPANQQLASMMPKVYNCPSDMFSDAASETSYLMVVGPDTVGDADTPTRIVDITDGTSNTIMLVEAAGCGVNWLEPQDWDTAQGDFSVNEGTGTGIESEHHGVANVLFCDGSVQGISWLEADEVKGLTTKSGGEPPCELDF